jgi:hypothetical protein
MTAKSVGAPQHPLNGSTFGSISSVTRLSNRFAVEVTSDRSYEPFRGPELRVIS